MKPRLHPLIALVATVALAPCAIAATYYWDGNGTTAGAGATPTGTWGTSAFWSTSVLGTATPANTTITAVDDVIFSAGTDGTGSYTVTTASALNVRNITIDRGNVTFSGAGGVITFGSGGGTFAVSSGTSVVGANTSTILAGTVGLTKTRGGTLTLNGTTAHTFTGGININGGTLGLDFVNMATATNLVASSNALSFSGGILTLRAKATGTTSQTFGNLTVGAGGGQFLVTPNGGGGVSVTLGSITSTARGGSLVLGNAPGTSGTAAFTTTSAPDATGIYGGRVVSSNGTAATGFDWAATASGASPYTLGNYSAYTALNVAAGSDTANSRISASATLGGARVTNTLKFENPAATQALALGGNLLTLTSGGLLSTGTNAATISGNSGLTTLTAGNGSGSYDLVVHQYNTGGLTISAVIGNNGANTVSLVKAGTGILTLSGVNTYTAPTYINAGTLLLTTPSAISASSAVNVATGASLQISAGNSATHTVSAFPLTLNGNGSTYDLDFPAGNTQTYNIGSAITVNNGAIFHSYGLINNYNYDAAITGNATAQGVVFRTDGGNTVNQAHTIKLGVASTYTGNTTLTATSQQGILKLGVANALPTTTVLTLAGGANANSSASLDLAGFSQSLVALSAGTSTGGAAVINTVNGTTSTLTLTGTVDSTYAGSIGSATANRSNIALTKGGSSNITLTGTNYHTGATTVTGGKLIFGNLTSIPVGTVTANAGASVSFGFAAGGTESAPTAYTVSKDLSLTGNSTTQATLDATANNRLNFSGTVKLSGETRITRFSNWGYMVFDGKITGTTGGATDNLTLFAAGGGLNQTQRFVFNNTTNDYDGSTTLLANFGSSAVLQTGASNVLPATTTLILNSNWGTSAANRGPMKTGETTGPNAPMVELQTYTQTVSSLSTTGGGNGTGGVSGRRIIWGGLSDPTSGTELGGTLNLTSTGNSISVGGSAGTALLIKSVSVNQTGEGSLANISGSNSLEILGGGLLQTKGVTGSGTLVLNGGTLQTGSTPAASWVSAATEFKLYDTAVASVSNTIDTNGSNGVVNAVISNFDSSAAGFSKIGSGVLTLSGANTYTGATSVSGGALVVNGVQALATGPVNISGSGTRLAGSGTVGGNTIINGGAVHSPGGLENVNRVGSQTFGANLKYEANSIFEWDLGANADTATGSAGSSFDQLTVGGSLTTASSTVFKVVVGEAVDFTANFWKQNREWSNIFVVTGVVLSAWSNSSVSVFNADNSSPALASYGSFSVSGTTLSWTAVPEPTSALAGILLGAGLVRRRRSR